MFDIETRFFTKDFFLNLITIFDGLWFVASCRLVGRYHFGGEHIISVFSPQGGEPERFALSPRGFCNPEDQHRPIHRCESR